MKRLLLLVLATIPLCASQEFKVARRNILASESLGKVSVFKDNDGFKVKNNGKTFDVPAHDVDKNLRSLNADQMKKLQLAGGLIKVNKLKNGDFTLGLDGQLKGGGPICGAIAGWAVRTASYAGISCAAWLGTTTAVAAGGGALAAGGGAVVVAKLGLGTAGKAIAAGLIQKGVATKVGLAVAAMGPQTIAMVEGAATTTQVAVTMIPWLP